MFNSARLKLTAWYLLIITLISASFSVAIYRVLTQEIDRIVHAQQLRLLRSDPFFIIDPDVIAESKRHLQYVLVLINLGIICSSAVAGYFLAGRTLQPIKEMVDDQNQFISDASHELRTPLTALKSEIEVNLRDRDLSLDTAKDLLKSNLEEVNNLQVMTDDLIKLSRFQGSGPDLEYTLLSLQEVVEEAIKKVSRQAAAKSVTISNLVRDYSFEANRSTIIELWIIFLDNAIKYSPDNSKITLNSKKDDGHIQVQISDQGVGIPKDEQQRIFDRFYRSDKSRTKSDAKGYGLGLSIAKQIVDRHLGTITVRSRPNSGTTFTVRLPVKH